MTFARPDLAVLGVLVPALLALFVFLYARRRRRVADALGESELVARLGGGMLRRFPASRLVLLAIAGAALGLAAAGPRWGREVTQGQTQALSVVLALDISKSMLVDDVKPSRLEQERLLIRRMLREMAGDRFGLVVFAGRAYVLSPVTVDHSALELYLDALAPDIVSQGGSSLAAAIALSTDLARGNRESTTEHAVVLVSDGEALEEADAVEDAVSRAARAGVHIYTVGVGTSDGGPVPDYNPRTGAAEGFKRDSNGETVISRMDETLLRRVAERTGGEYVQLSRPGAADRLARVLQRLDRTTASSDQRTREKERYALFVLIALACITLDALRAASGSMPRRPNQTRTAAAVVLIVALGTTAFGIGDLERGNRHYEAGRYREAAESYRKALQTGRATPELLYNLGTVLVRLGEYQEGAEYLNRAIDRVEPEVRQRALYNLGNRFLFDARAQKEMEPAARSTLLDAAAEAYRRSLRMDPQDADAKWNLELALREREQNQMQKPQDPGEDNPQPQQSAEDQQQQGGGGASASQSQSGGDSQGGSGLEQRPLTKEEADRILSGVEQDERELTRQSLRKGQRRTSVERDW